MHVLVIVRKIKIKSKAKIILNHGLPAVINACAQCFIITSVQGGCCVCTDIFRNGYYY